MAAPPGGARRAGRGAVLALLAITLLGRAAPSEAAKSLSEDPFVYSQHTDAGLAAPLSFLAAPPACSDSADCLAQCPTETLLGGNASVSDVQLQVTLPLLQEMPDQRIGCPCYACNAWASHIFLLPVSYS